MNIEIDGVAYIAANDVIEVLGISRQTLWRWRQDGKIPPGYRYRDRHVLFTPSEVDQIQQFANRIEPINHIKSDG